MAALFLVIGIIYLLYSSMSEHDDKAKKRRQAIKDGKEVYTHIGTFYDVRTNRPVLLNWTKDGRYILWDCKDLKELRDITDYAHKRSKELAPTYTGCYPAVREMVSWINKYELKKFVPTYVNLFYDDVTRELFTIESAEHIWQNPIGYAYIYKNEDGTLRVRKEKYVPGKYMHNGEDIKY